MHLFFNLMLVNGACVEGHSVTDGASSSPSKRAGWIASLFGSSKPSTSSNSSQESEEMSETDGGAKNKEEHITVPAKGQFCLMCDDYVYLVALNSPPNTVYTKFSLHSKRSHTIE